jgi:ABC-type Fe3+-hydroxamate transport system substrate-binding protein
MVMGSFAATRVVSLAQSITQMIYQLGSAETLVGCTSFCPNPSNKVEVVATAVDANVEKIMTLKPDVVIVTTLTKPQTIETLQKVGIRVVSFDYPKSFDDICNQFLMVARELKKENQAAQIMKEQKSRLESIRTKVSMESKPNVFLEIGVKPLFTVVPNTFMDDLITFSGGRNIAHDLKSGSITRESVLLRNPDYIFVVTMGVIGEEEKNVWLNYKSINAAKKKQVFILDSNKACTPTPQDFVDTLEEMVRIMNRKK